MNVLGMRSAIIGLDIGARSVKAAQVLGGELTAAVCLPRPDAEGGLPGETEWQQIATVLRSRPFRGRTVVASVPAKRLMMSILELPPRTSGAPVEQLARMELARRYDTQATEFEADCWDLPAPVRAVSRTCVMAVGCRTPDAEGLLNGLERWGLTVSALDVQAAALARSCRPLLAATGDTGAVLDVGWDSSRLVLVYHGTVVYERNLPRHGVAAMVSLLAGAKGVDNATSETLLAREGVGVAEPSARTDDGVVLRDDEGLLGHLDAMASDIRTPLSYLASQYADATIRRVVLAGGGAGIAGLAERLTERLGIETVRPSLEDLLPCDPDLADLGPAMAGAVGLAQYGEEQP